MIVFLSLFIYNDIEIGNRGESISECLSAILGETNCYYIIHLACHGSPMYQDLFSAGWNGTLMVMVFFLVRNGNGFDRSSLLISNFLNYPVECVAFGMLLPVYVLSLSIVMKHFVVFIAVSSILGCCCVNVLFLWCPYFFYLLQIFIESIADNWWTGESKWSFKNNLCGMRRRHGRCSVGCKEGEMHFQQWLAYALCHETKARPRAPPVCRVPLKFERLSTRKIKESVNSIWSLLLLYFLYSFVFS